VAVDPPTEVLPPGTIEGRAAVPVTEPASLIGRTLGRYEIVDKLGRGGSGDVFRAEQIGLARTVVVKVLRREHAATVNRVERFLREARLASRLDHPYAAHVYAFGAEPDGVLWIAMEYVRGATLDQLIARRGPTPAAVFAPLFTRLCEVVHTAHELGIVHRDIKGSNVMVIERAGQLLPKLLDFGIAKLDAGVPDSVDADSVDDPGSALDVGELTAVGSTLGSPHYMAPEQWSNAAEVDARADIYALGALAYRCMAGALPFQSADRRALADAHQRRPPPPLPQTVPVALADAILRALAKRPDDRWATALAFGEAVRFAVGVAAPEAVPIFDPYSRDVWLRAGPQPIADAIARIAAAATTVECDAALRDLVAITCRWLAVLALAGSRAPSADVRSRARGVVGSDDALPWLELARAAEPNPAMPGLTAALAGSGPLAALAGRLDSRDRPRTAQTLAADIADAADALRPIEPLLAYQLVVGRGDEAAESWQGPRRRDRDPVMVWGDALGDGEVALLDARGEVVARLSPLAQVLAPLPAAEPEMFLLWRSARGRARLVAAPWGFERDDDRAGELMAMLSTEDSDTAHDAGGDASPYPGLSAYGVDDADRFVGREREIEALANRLVRAPLLAVLGPSGAGKSSFVHAGVVPRLVESGYRVVTMRPGRHPMHALAALPPVSGDSHDEAAVAARLRELGESAPGTSHSGQRGLVIVIDQLEELVTLCADPAERTRFADALAAAADGPRSPVRVVVTLRDDFAAVIESEAALRGRFEVFVLGTPSPEALRRIVIEPARRTGIAVDDQVVDDMVAEVAGRPASLPLLSFTAAQLWRTRDKQTRTITRDAYLAVGGVAGALSTYADQVYDSLARKDQQVVRALFARLVAGDGTRIPAPRAELEQLPDTPAVLAHLIDARLLVVREVDGDDIVEIVHECLAERWDRLARWRREDAADRALVSDLRNAARRWLDTGRSPDLLWRGEALAELRRLVARSSALTDAERAFATAAFAAHRRARRLRRGFAVGLVTALAAVAIVMAYLGVAANRSADQARASAALADDRLTASLVAQGRRELNDSHGLQALAYFAEAMRRGADTPALRLMVGYAGRGRPFERAVYTNRTAALVADRDQFLIGGGDGAVHVDAPTGEERATIQTHIDTITELAVCPDHRVVAIGDRGLGGGVAVIDVDRRAVVAEFATDARPWHARLGPGADEVTVAASDALRVFDLHGVQRRVHAANQAMAGVDPSISPDARFAIYYADHRSHVLDLAAMTERLLPAGWAPAWHTPNGELLGAFDGSGALHVLDPEGATLHEIPRATTHGEMIVFADDDRELAVVGEHSIDVYGVTGGSAVAQLVVDSDLSAVMLDGSDVWVGDLEGSLRHYRNSELVGSIPSHLTQLTALAHAGDAVASVASDSTMLITTAAFAQLHADPPPCKVMTWAALSTMVDYGCGDKLVFMYGRQKLGEMPDEQPADATYSRALRRAAVVSIDRIYAFDRDGKLAGATRPGVDPTGPIAYADDDHLWVIAKDQLLRWRIGSAELEHVADLPQGVSIVATQTGPIVATRDGTLVFFAGDREVHRLALGNSVTGLDVSPDGRWLLATLNRGDAIVIDAAAATVVRKLTAGDTYGGVATFDDTGDFILRLVRSAIAVTERDTGVDLLFNVDLMHNAQAARGLADGRIELSAGRPTLIDIPRDTRPRDAIIRGIECRVPLHVVDASLAPVELPADCAPGRPAP
jgi:tRNA A-37 threonylcarbamoyl transferase component Bud32